MSVDWLAGRPTRPHGDTDIGVFRSEVEACLTAIGQDPVFLADPPGQLRAWQREPVPKHVDDVWILSQDREAWVLQVMIYTGDGDEVVFRRDPAIRWPRLRHTVKVRGLHVLNPAITLLYKSSRPTQVAKDKQDISVLIEACQRGWRPSVNATVLLLDAEGVVQEGDPGFRASLEVRALWAQHSVPR